MDKAETIARIEDQCSAGTLLEHSSGALLFEMDVTPDVAQAILAHLNETNVRRLDANHTRALADDRIAGKWWPSYTPLLFDKEWNLLDGQHRLRSIVQAGVTSRHLIAIYVPRDAEKGVDTGKKRNITVTHSVSGRSASAARLVIALKTTNRLPSQSAVAEEYLAQRAVYDRVEAACGRRKTMNNGTVIAAFAVALSSVTEGSREWDGIVTLLNDLADMGADFPMTRVIGKYLEGSHGNDIASRADSALCLLQAIRVHLNAETRSILRPTTAGLLSFVPNARYRSSVPSPALGGAHPRAAAAE